MVELRKQLILIALLLLLTSCSDNNLYEQKFTITPFSFIDQTGDIFTSKMLEGNVWIANFIFTNCDTVCPQMTHEMATLQEVFKEEELDVELVSFTVDPTVDSPDVLQDYIKQFTHDESNWHMLTGYSQKEIETFAREQFQTIVQKPEASSQVIHGINFYLIDPHGRLVNEYSYIDEFYVEDMIKDIRMIE